MKRKVVMRIILVALAVVMVGAGGAIASSFVWIGEAPAHNDDWTHCGNWVELGCMVCGCSPGTRDHDAGFRNDPDPASAWEVDFDDETITIDDLNISYSVNFNGPTGFGEAAELHMDTIVIGGAGNVIVTAEESMLLKAE